MKYIFTNDFVIQETNDGNEDGLTRDELRDAVRAMIGHRKDQISKSKQRISEHERDVSSNMDEIESLNKILIFVIPDLQK